MYDVIVVDDEAVVRVGLRAIVDWESYGFRLRGEFADGRAALEFLKGATIDLVITDIRMPVGDGLFLLDKLRRLPHPPLSVVLSGHDDFDLVRRALLLGAEDYLLKIDTKAEDLGRILREMGRRLDERRGTLRRDGTTTPAASIQSVAGTGRDRVRDLIDDGAASEEALREALAAGGLTLRQSTVTCIVIAYRLGESTTTALPDARGVNDESVCATVEEVVRHRVSGLCIGGKTGECLILVDGEREVESTTDVISELLLAYLNLSVSITVGVGDATLDGIRAAYADASRSRRPVEPSGGSLPDDGNLHTDRLRRRVVGEAERYIAQNFHRDISLTEVAESVDLSPAYFSTLFHRHTGSTFLTYLAGVRIEHAKRLLVETHAKIYEIAERSGFRSSQYFSRIFRRATGLSPGRFRDAAPLQSKERTQ